MTEAKSNRWELDQRIFLGASYWSLDASRWAAIEAIVETCRAVEKLASVFAEGNVRITPKDTRELRAALDRAQGLLDDFV